MLGARKHDFLSAEMVSRVGIEGPVVKTKANRHRRRANHVPSDAGIVGVYLRPVLCPSDVELLNEGMHV